LHRSAIADFFFGIPAVSRNKPASPAVETSKPSGFLTDRYIPVDVIAQLFCRACCIREKRAVIDRTFNSKRLVGLMITANSGEPRRLPVNSRKRVGKAGPPGHMRIILHPRSGVYESHGGLSLDRECYSLAAPWDDGIQQIPTRCPKLIENEREYWAALGGEKPLMQDVGS
jgi:hypothetical protein